MPTPDPRLQTILDNTVVVSPPLCPELRLRLIAPGCRLWRATEHDAADAGLPWPFWAFAWPGGQAVARYLLDHPEVVAGRTVLDFGAGCGIGAIAAAMAGARSVLAADIDPMSVLAVELNAALNDVSLRITKRDCVGVPVPEWEVVLVGDMYYDAGEASRTTVWLRDVARRGARVLVGDPHRGFFQPAGTVELARYRAPADNDADGSRLVDTGVYELLPDAP